MFYRIFRHINFLSGIFSSNKFYHRITQERERNKRRKARKATYIIWKGKCFGRKHEKRWGKGVDEEKSFVLYYDSRADESREELKRALKPYAAQDVP